MFRKISSFLISLIIFFALSTSFTSCIRTAAIAQLGKRASKIESKISDSQVPLDFSKEKSIIYVVNDSKYITGYKSIVKDLKKVFEKYYNGEYEFVSSDVLSTIKKTSNTKKLLYVMGVNQVGSGTLTSNTGFRTASEYTCTMYDLAKKKSYETSITSDYGTITVAYIKRLLSLSKK